MTNLRADDDECVRLLGSGGGSVPYLERAVRPLWHPTSAERSASGGTQASWRLVGEIHARRLGTIATACGESAAHWPMLIGRPFDPFAPNSCRRCAQALGARQGAQDKSA